MKQKMFFALAGCIIVVIASCINLHIALGLLGYYIILGHDFN